MSVKIKKIVTNMAKANYINPKSWGGLDHATYYTISYCQHKYKM